MRIHVSWGTELNVSVHGERSADNLNYPHVLLMEVKCLTQCGGFFKVRKIRLLF